MDWGRWVELVLLSLIVIGTGIYPKAATHGEFHLSFGGEAVSKKPAEVPRMPSLGADASTAL